MSQDPTEPFDKENAFLLYSIFCGDVKRTAHAIGVKEDLIEKLALVNGWDAQLKPIIDLKQSARAGDVERAINRALNFVQAHKTRMLLERVLVQLTGMSPSDLEAFLFPQKTKGGGEVIQTFSTRALADLASAIEKCHAMTYLALNDTSSDRKERGEDASSGAGESASEIHMKLAAAMSAAGGASKSIKGLVLDAQLEIAQEHAADPKGPA
jgi:hypothetical protein